MSRELFQPPGYIAANSAIGDAIGRGKKPHDIPDMVMRYLERHQKNSHVAAAPRVFKVKYLNLNKGCV